MNPILPCPSRTSLCAICNRSRRGSFLTVCSYECELQLLASARSGAAARVKVQLAKDEAKLLAAKEPKLVLLFGERVAALKRGLAFHKLEAA